MIIDIPMKYVVMLKDACMITADKIDDIVEESVRLNTDMGFDTDMEFIDWGQQQTKAYRKLGDCLMYMEWYDKAVDRG